ncbi:MAG: hypothetical protein ACFN4S_07145, partial [Prevotella conceptionensis]
FTLSPFKRRSHLFTVSLFHLLSGAAIFSPLPLVKNKARYFPNTEIACYTYDVYWLVNATAKTIKQQFGAACPIWGLAT